MTESDTGIKWFAAYTAPRMEAEADADLRRQGYMTFYPFFRERKKRKIPNRPNFRLEWVDVPYFPRYLFFAMRGRPGESFAAVNETNGIATTIYLNDRPLRVPSPVMDELMARANEGGLISVVDPTKRKRFGPGQKVRFIASSPFAGLVAEIERDAGNRTRVWLETFKTANPVEVDPALLELMTT